jgi:hypothetical protein
MGVIVRRGPPVDKTVLAIPAVQPCGEEPTESRRDSDRVYGSYHRYVADAYDCTLLKLKDHVSGKRHRCRGKITAHHLDTVGSGGEDAANVNPVCVQAHDEFHTLGVAEVARRYQIDPWEIALRIFLGWQKFTGRTGAEA